MSDPVLPTANDDLRAEVLDQLLALRSAKGVLTPQKLARFPALIEVMGGGDLLDAFMAFRRELRRYIESANRNEKAAALSIYAKDEHVGERFQYVANRLGDRDVREQRTARRWSDEGMPALADDLVYMAEVQGRLGRELLHIELEITDDGALAVSVDQMVLAHLPVRAPEVTLWAMNSSGDPEELSLDLGRHPATEATKGDYRMIRQRISLAPELLDRITPERSLALAVTGRDAPMRTISFVPPATTPPGVAVVLSAYRTRAAVELTRKT